MSYADFEIIGSSLGPMIGTVTAFEDSLTSKSIPHNDMNCQLTTHAALERILTTPLPLYVFH